MLKDQKKRSSQHSFLSLLSQGEEKVIFIDFDIKIQDFGCGISSENINKLFIDFSKMEESASQNKHGVGLGLSICKNLIEYMSGSVRVQSEEGKGTTFTINFRTHCKV